MRRIIVGGVVMVLLAGVGLPALHAGQAGSVQITICHDARRDGRRWVGVDCSPQIEQQAPRVAYLVTGLDQVRGWVAVEDSADPERLVQPSSRIVSHLTGASTAAYFTMFTHPLPPGPRYVRMVSLADRTLIARTTYEIVGQTPQEAVAAWEGKSGWRGEGLAGALVRMGEVERAERVLRRLAEDPATEPTTRYNANVMLLRIYLVKQDSDAAIQLARQLVATNGQAGDHVWLVRVLSRFCRIEEARAATVAALRAYPEDPRVRELARLLVEAEERCRGESR